MTRPTRHWTARLSAVVPLAALTAALLAGCGSAESGAPGGHPDYAKALAGSPPPLAALHRQESRLLGGGLEAFEARLRALRGYPVVVNVWASWCGPCRQEFPLFQQAAAAEGRRVAFLGVDVADSAGPARGFLRQRPVPYPSYEDPGEDLAAAVGATRGVPDTAFYDASGGLAHLHQGPYDSTAELRADIRRYAAGG